MSHKITGNEKVDEAMQLLMQASCEKKMEFTHYVADLYKSFKDAEHQATRKIKDTVECANKHVHEKPWAYVVGAALGGLLVGLFYHRRR